LSSAKALPGEIQFPEVPLKQIQTELGQKLKPEERKSIELEFEELNEILERLKSGLVWVGLFGKTSVGKSAILNAILGKDVAKVGVEIDLTSAPVHYQHDPWMITDMPGVMGRSDFEKIAMNEARKSHGIVFVVDGEPYQDEIEMFDAVHRALPKIPKLVFVNKWDKMQHGPSADRDTVRRKIWEKMHKYVASEDDIVFGAALIFDAASDKNIRQQLPQLIDRMYESAGTLGMVINVLDPARRAENAGSKLKDKIMDVRVRLARKIVSGFAAAEVAGSYIPFTTLVTTPGILAGMVYTLMRVLGVKSDKAAATKLATQLIKVCLSEMAVEFGVVTAAELALPVVAFFAGPLAVLGALGAMGGIGYYKYRRTAIFGEVAIEYIRHDCSWGGEDIYAVIQRCRKRAEEHYMKFKWKHDV
jgi:GTP-binding protein EngB required for normal cell division/uncharacterized protein (DUF697 family)